MRSAAGRAGGRRKPPRPERAPGAGALAWSVYVLRCGDGSLYTGATNDVPRRLAQHAAGRGARYTRARLPVALVHVEPAGSRGDALRREAALKRLPRAAKLALVTRRPAVRAARRGVPGARPALPRPARAR